MDRLLKKPGHTLHPPGSPQAQALLIERGLTRADLDRALAELKRTEGIAIRTIVGINDDGVFGSRRENWHPISPMPAPSPSSPCSGSRSWRPCAQGQHGKIPRGWHPAGLIGPTRAPYAAAASPGGELYLNRNGCSPPGAAR